MPMPTLLSEVLLRGLPYYYYYSPFIVSIFLLIFLLNYLFPGQHNSMKSPPPSPPKLPIIGNLHQLGGKLPHHSFLDLSKKYGPLMLLHLGQSPTLVVSSAEMVEEIVKHHDVVFSNRPSTTAIKILSYGGADFGFAPYGEYWRKARKVCVAELLSHKRVESFKLAREEEVASLVHKIRTLAISNSNSNSNSNGSTSVINLSGMIRAANQGIVSRIIMGQKADEELGDGKFGELAKRYVNQLSATSFEDLFPNCMGTRWLDVVTGLVPRLKASFAEMDAFLDSVVQEQTANLEGQNQTQTNENEMLEKNFVQILLHLQKEGLLGFTHDNLKAILLDMFAGANETSATALEWAMAELMKNPKVMKKGQEEVRRVVGRKGRVEEDDVKQMAYLKCIVKETLRLHPPAPLMIPRETRARIEIRGYEILPKTTVLVNVWAIQRDPKYWDRPEDFIPERFENNPVDFIGQLGGFEFISFGVGRRACPGTSFAVAVLQVVLANLLYWFDWKLFGTLDMTEAFGIAVSRKFPLQLVPVNVY